LILKTTEQEDRARLLDQERTRMELEKGQSEIDIDTLGKNFEELASWLNANDNTSKIDIDQITEPKDLLSKQLLYLVAEDATIEDALYYLEKKMVNRELPVDVFLKYVRNLSCDQFSKRATIKKIHEKQKGRQ